MKTWNVWVGCDYLCAYCNARQAALTRLRNSPRYKDGFTPHLVEEELSKKFAPGDFVFVGYMGDISFAPRPIIIDLCTRVQEQPEVNFLFCTKNPLIYWYWHIHWPENLYLGATIESNIDHGVTKAPAPFYRYQAMRALDHPKKFISIEPIMNFHLATFVTWIKEIKPEIIEVGADNYHNDLPEPRAEASHFSAPWKVRWLLEDLKQFCPTVVEKVGLERLSNDKAVTQKSNDKAVTQKSNDKAVTQKSND